MRCWIVLNEEQLAARREVIAGSRDLSGLLRQLLERAAPVIAKPPAIPGVKALLSVDGGACPRDGTALTFDPWSPHLHRCPRCGEATEGERHHRWWARFQHLWLGERSAHLASLSALGRLDSAGDAARRLLREYGARYLDYPNNDNVLGPARLFFSTYLESIWITNVMSAALLLRAADQLDEETVTAVDVIANEAANLIGEFNEGFSNRQTWHDAALVSLALWFEDEALLRAALEEPTGLIPHLTHGFGDDGMWFEGENYHLFALRGLLVGLCLARSAGLDAFADRALSDRIARALRAPILTALPDHTFPARKDSRFGVSLAQPMYLELWEAGLAAVNDPAGLAEWLVTLYSMPAPPALAFDSWLHDAGLPPPTQRNRTGLSWWMLTSAAPALAAAGEPWSPASALLEAQGLAVLRRGSRYVSLETGALGGGHGHPDRLHLTLHQDGVHWLPDPGAGSYVARDLYWYRSTLAHNAPRLDGASQPMGDAVCEYFHAEGEWSWARGRYGDVSRTVVSGPDHLLDLVELAAPESHTVELPWHLAGSWEVVSRGRWESAALEDEFVSGVERFVPANPGAIALTSTSGDGDTALSLALLGADELLRATGPGVPGTGTATFLVARASGRAVRLGAVLVPGARVPGISMQGELIAVETSHGACRHRPDEDGWRVETPGAVVTLTGRRPPLTSRAEKSPVESMAHAVAVPVAEPPLPDELASRASPLLLDREDQYRRSEEVWAGEHELSARAWTAWNTRGFYLTVHIRKPELVFRLPDAEPLRLDNEPDDIHSDGIQVYLRPLQGGPVYGFLIVPAPEGTLRVHRASDTAGAPGMVTGRWERRPDGYQMSVTVILPDWDHVLSGDSIGFDLIVNEMRPGRERRAGQLVWGGDGGWVWLRGDRCDPARFGVLELGAS